MPTLTLSAETKNRTLGLAPAAPATRIVEERRMAQPILLVDDDPTVLQLVGLILRRDGYDVLEARDAAQALQIAQEKGPISLVLSDIVMPGMSGVQLCEQLKALRPGLKVILMSGNDFGLLASDQGAHFLPKPFFPHDLLEKVREVLAVRSW